MTDLKEKILRYKIYRCTDRFVKESSFFFKKYDSVMLNQGLERLTISANEEDFNRFYLIKRRLVKEVNPMLLRVKNYSEVLDYVDLKLNPIRENVSKICKALNIKEDKYLP